MHQRAPATPTVAFSAANLEAWTICLFMCVCELRKAGRQCVYVELTQAAEAQHTSCGHIIVRRHHRSSAKAWHLECQHTSVQPCAICRGSCTNTDKAR